MDVFISCLPDQIEEVKNKRNDFEEEKISHAQQREKDKFKSVEFST